MYLASSLDSMLTNQLSLPSPPALQPVEYWPSPVVSSIVFCILGSLFPAALFRSYRSLFKRCVGLALLKLASLVKLLVSRTMKLQIVSVFKDESALPSCTTASFASSATSASEEEIHPRTKILEKVFNFFDENRDGLVSRQELRNIFDKLNLQIADDSLETLINSAGGRGEGGNLQFHQFQNLYESFCDESCSGDGDSGNEATDGSGEMWEAFCVYDKDGDGFISKEELQRVLMSLGFTEGADMWVCEEMIRRVDTNYDGRIDFAEFKQMMLS